MLSVVIPTYKEAQNVDILIQRMQSVLSSSLKDFTLILVDDNSQDGIADVVGRQQSQVSFSIQLIERKDKKGLASAWQDGIRVAKTPYVAIMDADLAHSPEDLLKIFKEISACDADMVIGSRYLPGRLVKMENKSIFAIYLSALGQRLTRLILGINVYDMSHSFRVFKKSAYENIEKFLECSGNAMMIEFTFHTARSGLIIKEIPIHYGKRLHGETKLAIWKEGMRFLTILLTLKKKYPK